MEHIINSFDSWRQLMFNDEYTFWYRYIVFWDDMNPNYTNHIKELQARLITHQKGVRVYNEIDWKQR